MADIHIISVRGEHATVSGSSGDSLLQILLEAGAEGIGGLCGGSCSCGTCHIYVEKTFFDRLAAATPDEHSLLDCSDYRLPTSRLACQILFDDRLDGMTVTVAPQD